MSSWQPIQNCRSNGGKNEHSWTDNNGITYEICQDNRKWFGFTKKGNAVSRYDDNTCKYPEGTAFLWCQPSTVTSNKDCPDGFTKNNDGSCSGNAHGVDVHRFPDYSDTQKARWACNASREWKAVLPNRPSGKTWWIGDENSGYCTNNKVEILTKGKCDVYGQIIDMTSPEAQNKSRYECRSANGFTKYNPYNFKPGDKDAMASQILANLDFKLENTSFEGDQKATLENEFKNMIKIKVNATSKYPSQSDGGLSYCGVTDDAGKEDKYYYGGENFNAQMEMLLKKDWIKTNLEQKMSGESYNPPYWKWEGNNSCEKSTSTGSWGKKYKSCKNCSFDCNNNLNMKVSDGLTLNVYEDKEETNCAQYSPLNYNENELRYDFDNNRIRMFIYNPYSIIDLQPANS